MDTQHTPNSKTTTTRGLAVPVVLGVILVAAAIIALLTLGEKSESAPPADGSASNVGVSAPPSDSAPEATTPATAEGGLADQVQAQGLFRGPKQKVSERPREAGIHQADTPARGDGATEAPGK